jgi:hypothetical protein
MEEEYRRQLVALIAKLSRLFSPRSATPKVDRYKRAYCEIERFARYHGHDEEWCDRLMLSMLEERRVGRWAAPRAA